MGVVAHDVTVLSPQEAPFDDAPSSEEDDDDDDSSAARAARRERRRLKATPADRLVVRVANVLRTAGRRHECPLAFHALDANEGVGEGVGEGREKRRRLSPPHVAEILFPLLVRTAEGSTVAHDYCARMFDERRRRLVLDSDADGEKARRMGTLVPVASLEHAELRVTRTPNVADDGSRSYGACVPVAKQNMIVRPPDASERDPRVVVVFPLSDPDRPLRCAQLTVRRSGPNSVALTVSSEGNFQNRTDVTTFDLSVAKEDGETDELLPSSVLLDELFGKRTGGLPTQKMVQTSLPTHGVDERVFPCTTKEQNYGRVWTGFVDLGGALWLQRETSSLTGVVMPTFVSRAIAEFAARRLRLHTLVNAANVRRAGEDAGGHDAAETTPTWSSTVAVNPSYVVPIGAGFRTLLVRTVLHSTYCGCICGAHTTLSRKYSGSRASYQEEEEVRPSLDLYFCGRKTVGGRCPFHKEGTRLRCNRTGICLEHVSLRLRCAHKARGASKFTNRLDHEILPTPDDSALLREIATCAAEVRSDLVSLYQDVDLRAEDATEPGSSASTRQRQAHDSLMCAAKRFSRATAQYRVSEAAETRDESSAQRDDPLVAMDALATKLMVDGRFFCEIGQDPLNATSEEEYVTSAVRPYYYSALRVGRDIRFVRKPERKDDLVKLWKVARKGGRERIDGSKRDVEFYYGRLFPHALLQGAAPPSE